MTAPQAWAAPDQLGAEPSKLDGTTANAAIVAGTNNGQGYILDNHTLNVERRQVVISGQAYLQVRRAWNSRDMALEVREVGTTNVLRTGGWGYTWNNDNSAWTAQNNPPPPNGETCAGAYLSPQSPSTFHSVYGITLW